MYAACPHADVLNSKTGAKGAGGPTGHSEFLNGLHFVHHVVCDILGSC